MCDFAEMVENLLKLPQSLCKGCGQCCQFASFKGGLTYEELLKLSQQKSDDEHIQSQIEGAKDFLSVFVPFDTIEDAKKVDKNSVEKILEIENKKEVGFYYCKYLNEDKSCKIHEDRPDFCRKYPTVHPRQFFFPNCGYKEKALENWKEIEQIQKYLNELLLPTKQEK